eukprot:2486386-Amphidinium_carterae.1
MIGSGCSGKGALMIYVLWTPRVAKEVLLPYPLVDNSVTSKTLKSCVLTCSQCFVSQVKLLLQDLLPRLEEILADNMTSV